MATPGGWVCRSASSAGPRWSGASTLRRAACSKRTSLPIGAGDDWGLAQYLCDLGDVARCQRDDARSRALYEESLAVFRALGAKGGVASVLHNLGYLAAYQDALDDAARQFRDSLTLFRALGDRHGIAECLIGLAGVAVSAGEAERAARLFGAAEAQLAALGHGRSGPRTGPTATASSPACTPCPGPRRVRRRLGRGAGDLAGPDPRRRPGGSEDRTGAPPAETNASPDPLTPREREIVALIARGRTNRQIADALVIARPTADRHVANILKKLDLSNRAQVAAWATERSLRPG